MLRVALIQPRLQRYLAASQRQVWSLHFLCRAQYFSSRYSLFKNIMSSDDAYGAFLDQSNQDTGAGKASTKRSSLIETKTVDTEVPAQLQNVKRFGTYTSEADELFEPVSLKWAGDELPTEDEFKDLIGHGSNVEKWTDNDFDSEGKYEAALCAVRNAGDGSALIFRVELGRTRVEYYIVSQDKTSKTVVGLRAKSVES